MEDTPRTGALGGRPIRLAAALLAIAAVVGVVFAVRAGRGDDSVAAPPARETAAVEYGAPVYHLCPDDVGADAVTGGGAPVIGQPAPDFALCDDQGEFVTTLSGMQGKVVWLNFWATWCVPCKKELPDIQKLYDEKRGQGLEVLLVNLEESQARAIGFLPVLGIEMPVVLDRDGKVYERYRLTGLPDSFFIGRDGNVAALYYGFVTEEIARDRLAMAGLE